MTTISTIIFDMDGVITDTEPLHARAELKVCALHNLSAPKKLWAQFKGRTTHEIFSILIKNAERTDLNPNMLTKEKIQYYLSEAPCKITSIPGAITFIQECKRRGYTLALTTSSVRPIADLTLKKCNLTHTFSAITTGEEVRKGKPSPEPYLLSLQKLDAQASSTVVIEDSISGIHSANTAGCISIGITTTFSKKELLDAGAKYVVVNFEELATFLFSRNPL